MQTGEAERLQALYQYRVLDTPPEAAFDELTALAGQICAAPAAGICLLAEDRKWFKSALGLSLRQAPRDGSFCALAVCQGSFFVVPDTASDARLAHNPLVTGDHPIRFYAGVPLLTAGGQGLGALCVMDYAPRQLLPGQQDALQVLSRQVMAQLELHRQRSQQLESETLLQIATENARVGLVVVNRARRYAYANSTYAKILGLKEPSIVGRRIAEVLPEVYETQIGPRLDRAFGGERLAYELHKSTADGDRYYAVRYEPVGNHSVVVVITDTTESKQAEESLRLSHERFELVARATNDAIWDWNPTTQQIWWNTGYQTLFGHSPEDTSSSMDSRTDFIHPEDSERVLHRMNQAILSGDLAWSDEYRFRRGNGTYADIFDRCVILRDEQGSVVRMAGAMQDVSQRRQAERLARRLAATVEFSDDAILGKDLDGTVTSWNNGAERLFGYSAAEMLGRSMTHLLPPDRQDEEREILETIIRDETVKQMETVPRFPFFAWASAQTNYEGR